MNVSAKTDPYDWSVEHSNDLHFILYKGTEMIGYAHVERIPVDKATIRFFIIDDAFRTKEVESEFIKLCQRWLKKIS